MDTGTSLIVVNKKIFNKIKANCENLKFRTFRGETVPALGETKVNVAYDNQEAQVPLFVVTGKVLFAWKKLVADNTS